MKKSDVFTPKFPSPTDSDLYGLYKKFVTLQQEIAKNWKEEFLTGMIGFRAYADLRDVRLSVSHLDDEKDPAIIISLKPVVGQDTIDDLTFYVQLFRTYQNLVSKISADINIRHKLQRCSIDKLDGPGLQFLACSRSNIHAYITALRFLLMAANHDVLTRDHLDTIGQVVVHGAYNEMINERMNATIRGLKFSQYFSDKFQNGGDYFDHPEQDVVNAFYRWAHA